MCRAGTPPASSAAQQTATLQLSSQERIPPVRVAPLAPPESTATGSKRDAQQPSLSAAKEQEQDTGSSKQETSKQRGDDSAAISGNEKQAGKPQPHLSHESAAQAPVGQNRQHAVVYELDSSQAAHAALTSSTPTANHPARAAVYHLDGTHQSRRLSAGSPAPSGCMDGGIASQAGARGGLSIAQQAVLRCRQKHLEQGEPQQGLQQPRPPQGHSPSADSGSRQAGASPSQHVSSAKAPGATAECSGGLASRQREARLHGPHDSASSRQVEQALPRAQGMRRDSDRGQSTYPAGAACGNEALGTPQRAGSGLAAQRKHTGEASTGQHAERRKQGDVTRHRQHRPAHLDGLVAPPQDKKVTSPVTQVRLCTSRHKARSHDSAPDCGMLPQSESFAAISCYEDGFMS